MARNVREKIANGDSLDEQDVQYAVERGIELPEQYGQKAAAVQHDMGGGFGRPPTPVVDQGSFPMPDQRGPGLFLTPDQLGSLKKDELLSVAEAVGVEASGTKSEIVAALTGTEASGGDDEEDEG